MSTRPKKYKPCTKPKCGATTRAGGGHPCRRVAGFGTYHLGTGRCKYHGGATPIIHGRYSKVVPTVMRASYLAAKDDADAETMKEELALLNGVIISGAVKRGILPATHEGEVDPLDLTRACIDTKSKILKRQYEMDDHLKIKFTLSGLRALIVEVVSVVAEFVDQATLKKITARLGTQYAKRELGSHDADGH